MFASLSLSQLRRQMALIAKFKINRKKDRKRTQHKIRQILKDCGIIHTHGEFDRAIGNAMAHGQCPVRCRLYLMGKHFLCVVKDSGIGFDYHETIRKFQNKEIYYHHHGFGMRSYASNPHLRVDWTNHGNTILLLYI